jgi:alpha-beta hydrolase superfamily lysophospholipase
MTRFVDSGARTPGPEDGVALRTLVFGVRIPKPQSVGSPTGETHVVQGLELWHSPGERGTVALFHGYAASKDQLIPVANAYEDLGWGTVLVDFAGHGNSAGAPRTTIGWREADDVAIVAAWAQDLPQPLILYGFSMGTAAILRACAVHQVHADAMVLEAPFDTLRGTVGNRFEMMGAPASPGAELLLFWGGATARMRPFQHRPVRDAASCSIPAVVIGGTHDVKAKPADVGAVADALGVAPVMLEMGHELGALAQPTAWELAVQAALSGP